MRLWPQRSKPPNWQSELGRTCVLGRVRHACQIPAPCFGLPAAPNSLRLQAGQSLAADGYLVHPGPYVLQLFPHPASTEISVRLSCYIEQADPRLPQQRFELCVQSEISTWLEASDWLALDELQQQLQLHLAQAQLPQLYTCPQASEWLAWRNALERWLYVRYGLVVEDCLPQEAVAQTSLAQRLLAQASMEVSEMIEVAQVAKLAQTPAAPAPATPSQASAVQKAALLRRLYLELPALRHAWRMLPWPSDLALFASLQSCWQELDQLHAELANPSQSLIRHCDAQALQAAIEQAWALLATLQTCTAQNLPPQLPAIQRSCAALSQVLKYPR